MIALEIAALMLFIAGASFFAGSETGFVSWNPLKVEHRAGGGDIVARWALFLIKNKNCLLSAQLIGNNVCVIGASLTFAALFETVDHALSWELSRIPSPESWFLTPFIVLFGEMLPKSLYRLYPFILTMRSVPLLMIVYFVTFPLTVPFFAASGFFRRSESVKGDSFMTKVREEMVLIALEGTKIGTLFKSADVFIQSILTLNEKRVGKLNPEKAEKGDNGRFYAHERVGAVKTRVPDLPEILVYHPNGKTVCGTVSLFDLLLAPEDATLQSYCRPLPLLEAGRTLFAALRSIDGENHYFLVKNPHEEEGGIIDRSMLLKEVFNPAGIKPKKM